MFILWLNSNNSFSGAVVTGQLRKNKKIDKLGFEMEVVDLVKPITKYAVLLKNKDKKGMS